MTRFDVTIVGAGPAGSACAKTCAENGLKTVLLEKRRLPRDKVCSGMVMGDLPSTTQRDAEAPEEAENN